MPQSPQRFPQKNVVAHWHKLIENLQSSSKDFYTSVEGALSQRKIPRLTISRVDWNQGGILSPRREYLRVAGERHSFDICAAPFGTGFFFSSWLTEIKASWVLLYAIGFAAAGWLVARLLMFIVGMWPNPTLFVLRQLHLTWVYRYPLTGPITAGIVSVVVVMWLVAIVARRGIFAPERAMSALPIVGVIYRRLFLPETYYRIDTMLMFQSLVHSAMMEMIDGVTTQKGLRALTDDERKPVFNRLM